jgi:hypothetical protein
MSPISSHSSQSGLHKQNSRALQTVKPGGIRIFYAIRNKSGFAVIGPMDPLCRTATKLFAIQKLDFAQGRFFGISLSPVGTIRTGAALSFSTKLIEYAHSRWRHI